jgi:hypothetical protein
MTKPDPAHVKTARAALRETYESTEFSPVNLANAARWRMGIEESLSTIRPLITLPSTRDYVEYAHAVEAKYPGLFPLFTGIGSDYRTNARRLKESAEDNVTSRAALEADLAGLLSEYERFQNAPEYLHYPQATALAQKILQVESELDEVTRSYNSFYATPEVQALLSDIDDICYVLAVFYLNRFDQETAEILARG